MRKYIYTFAHHSPVIDPYAAGLVRKLQRGPARFSALLPVVGNPATLSARLKDLRAQGWVAKAEGAYHLTARGEQAAGPLLELERVAEPAPRLVVDRVPHPYFAPLLEVLGEELLRRFGDDLQGLLLFGSVARGDWTRDSDIDLLVLLAERAGGRQEVLSKLLRARKALRHTPAYRRAYAAGFVPTVEFHFLTVPEAARFHRLYLEAFTEGVVLFDREGTLAGLIERFWNRLKKAGGKRIESPSVGPYWELDDPAALGGPL